MSRPLKQNIDGRYVSLRILSAVWLIFVWILLWGNVSWGNIITGVIVTYLVMRFLPLPRVPVEGRVHIGSVIKLISIFLWDLLYSSVLVAYYAFRPQGAPMSAVLRAHVNVKSDFVLTMYINFINLVPGTLVVDVDEPRRILYIHTLDVSSEKAVQAFYDDIAQIERLFVRAFERDEEWHASPLHGKDDEFHHVTAEEHRKYGSRNIIDHYRGEQK